jgi:hypothetical protein
MSNSVRAVSVAAAVAACVAMILLTWHVWRYFFLYDDFALVAIAGGTSWKTLATTPQIGFFRPLPFLVMRAEFGLVQKGHASAYAFGALVIHFVNSAVVGVLARKIGLRRPLAFTAAVLFLVGGFGGGLLLAQFDVRSLLRSWHVGHPCRRYFRRVRDE